MKVWTQALLKLKAQHFQRSFSPDASVRIPSTLNSTWPEVGPPSQPPDGNFRVADDSGVSVAEPPKCRRPSTYSRKSGTRPYPTNPSAISSTGQRLRRVQSSATSAAP